MEKLWKVLEEPFPCMMLKNLSVTLSRLTTSCRNACYARHPWLCGHGYVIECLSDKVINQPRYSTSGLNLNLGPSHDGNVRMGPLSVEISHLTVGYAIDASLSRNHHCLGLSSAIAVRPEQPLSLCPCELKIIKVIQSRDWSCCVTTFQAQEAVGSR